jgi:hypothetical protein
MGSGKIILAAPVPDSEGMDVYHAHLHRYADFYPALVNAVFLKTYGKFL